MKHLRVATLIIYGMACFGISYAAQDSFDLNLQELKQPKPQKEEFDLNLKELSPKPSPAKPKPKPAQKPAQASHRVKDGEHSSTYTVRPGDHLFLILMRSYHLSNQAAENLIPEVMRINHIKSVHGLTVGQRLTIPLTAAEKSAKAEEPAKKSRREAQPRKKAEPEKPAVSEAEDVKPLREQKMASPTEEPAPPTKPAQAESEPATAAKAPANEQNRPVEPALPTVTVSAAPPCQLARAMAEKLGLLAPDLVKPMAEQEIFTANNAGLNVVVACGLSTAEAYTYERLLLKNDTILLSYDGSERYPRVVERLANRLGLEFQAGPENGSELPLVYEFSNVAKQEKLRLTIVPAEK